MKSGKFELSSGGDGSFAPSQNTSWHYFVTIATSRAPPPADAIQRLTLQNALVATDGEVICNNSVIYYKRESNENSERRRPQNKKKFNIVIPKKKKNFSNAAHESYFRAAQRPTSDIVYLKFSASTLKPTLRPLSGNLFRPIELVETDNASVVSQELRVSIDGGDRPLCRLIWSFASRPLLVCLLGSHSIGSCANNDGLRP
ncbi:hypothetical protein EVAR_69842_1 [Eumeta japonica]|uniref:Uncharacterized protein n=1 Tax=Eumeta variegata TaxID=151549 RepID=A0A4C1SHK3_EUMVA|nr:hypothetical protein EVAR_69842_1 [Eumeta japonica]